MKNQKGFTLIELMIVVAIIAILAAIAISQYQDYVIRSQASEGSSLADGMKTAVAEFYNNYGRFSQTGDNTSYGLAMANSVVGSYTASVGVHAGKIQASYGLKANSAITAAASRVLSFSPLTHAGSIEWNCKSTAGTTIKNKYRPTVCRD